MHLKYFILLAWGSVHSFRHLDSLCPMCWHFPHWMMSFSVQSLAWCPTLLHLKHIFSLQSKLSWVSLPQRIQLFLFISLGHSFAICPNYLQLWHFIVGFSSAQYRVPLSFFRCSKASSSLSSAFLSVSEIGSSSVSWPSSFWLDYFFFSSLSFAKYSVPRINAPLPQIISGLNFVLKVLR